MLDPAPVAGTPQVLSRGTMAGLMDIALHPDFAQNKWIYISYHKPLAPGVAASSVLRGTWDGKALTDVRDVFVSDDVDTEASRIVFGKDGMLYMGIGGPGTGPHVSVDRAQHTNDLAGKVLRLKDDGSVPPDNPFVGKSGYKPAIFTIGHRVQLGLTLNPFTGEIWEHENGPNGGDELNVLKPGRNYGWPIVSYGRDYNGPRFPPSAPGFEEPVVFWVPSIAASGLMFYTGDRFPGGSATRLSVGCAKAKWRRPDSSSGSCSTTSGRSSGASRCCATSISAFGTCGRVQTGCCIC